MSERPLLGRSVVVTRAPEQTDALVGLVESLGGSVVVAPTIRFAEPSDSGAAADDAAARLTAAAARRPEWVVFTSANAVARFLTAERFPGGVPAALEGVSVAAVGPATGEALSRMGVPVDLVPRRFVAESLLEEFPDPTGAGTVWLPRAEVAREVLPEGLRARGWRVEVIPTYRTLPAVADPEVRDRVAAADAVIFASGSAVEAFLDIYGAVVPPVVAAIGPVTAGRARDHGIDVAVEPAEHTLEATVRALAEYFAAPA